MTLMTSRSGLAPRCIPARIDDDHSPGPLRRWLHSTLHLMDMCYRDALIMCIPLASLGGTMRLAATPWLADGRHSNTWDGYLHPQVHFGARLIRLSDCIFRKSFIIVRCNWVYPMDPGHRLCL